MYKNKNGGEKMKKAILVLLSLLVFLSIGTFLWYFFFSGMTNITSDSAVLVYKYNDKDIHETLTKEESAIFKKMFNHKWLGHDMPSCGSDPDISIRFGEEIFMPDLDGHNGIGTKDSELYFGISDSERKTLNKIFKKYGATFPAL